MKNMSQPKKQPAGAAKGSARSRAVCLRHGSAPSSFPREKLFFGLSYGLRQYWYPISLPGQARRFWRDGTPLFFGRPA